MNYTQSCKKLSNWSKAPSWGTKHSALMESLSSSCLSHSPFKARHFFWTWGEWVGLCGGGGEAGRIYNLHNLIISLVHWYNLRRNRAVRFPPCACCRAQGPKPSVVLSERLLDCVLIRRSEMENVGLREDKQTPDIMSGASKQGPETAPLNRRGYIMFAPK